MQIVVTVICKPKYSGSLRDIIISDLEKGRHELNVDLEKKPGRPNGWAKVSADGLPGKLNISWEAAAKTLIVRAIAKRGNNPHELLGRFLSYLMQRRRHRISSILIRPS